jgi:hypothetical protein
VSGPLFGKYPAINKRSKADGPQNDAATRFFKTFFFYLCKGWQTMGDLLGIFWALSFNFGGLGVKNGS